MPGGQTSLQAWTPAINTAQVASAYKANLDGNSSIHSNMSGMLNCYPNTPVGLSVLVDPAFNLWTLGGGGTNGGPILLNTAASPVTVSLVAPASNSYYATIYWNPTTNTAGVVYSAPSATPFPILPDAAEMLPLACVLIATGQATIAAGNIYDARTFFRFGPIRYQNAALAAPVTINAAGATLLTLDTKLTAAATMTVNNLQVGVPVYQIMRASTFTLTLNFNTPSGVAYSLLTKISGAVANFSAMSPWVTSTTQAYLLYGCTLYEGSAPYLIAPYN